jgi:hypothetical protein
MLVKRALIFLLPLFVIAPAFGQQAPVAQPSQTELATTLLTIERLTYYATASKQVPAVSAYVHAYQYVREQVVDSKVAESLKVADNYMANVVTANVGAIESSTHTTCGSGFTLMNPRKKVGGFTNLPPGDLDRYNSVDTIGDNLRTLGSHP